MLATLTTVVISLGLIIASTLLLIKAFRAFGKREKAFTKVTIPPGYYPPINPCETQPMMVGLSQTIEEAVAKQAADKLAADIEFDLFRGQQPPAPTPEPEATTADGLNAMIGYYDQKRADDDWSTIVPPKPKRKKRKAPAKKKPAPEGAGQAR